MFASDDHMGRYCCQVSHCICGLGVLLIGGGASFYSMTVLAPMNTSLSVGQRYVLVFIFQIIFWSGVMAFGAWVGFINAGVA